MKLTSFIFFKNTPLIDFQNTIFFESNDERDDFFLNGYHYSSIEYQSQTFNFIRDRQSIKVEIPYKDVQGINYCTFLSDFEPDIRYYAYVISYEYLNDNVTEINLLIDGIMTFCQGQTISNFKNLSVSRKHMSLIEYNNRLDELKNNDDVIKTYSKTYTDEYEYVFTEFDVLIQSSCSFTMDFGTVNDPKIETSDGLTFDKISTPLNVYVVKQSQFTNLMNTLAPYPWIAQNIRSISLIPSILLEGQTVKAHMSTGNFNELYMLLDNGKTNRLQFNSDLLSVSKTMNEMYDIFGLDSTHEKHLLRSEYTTTELYTLDGQSLFIDNGLLNETVGFLLQSVFVSGVHSEIGIYVDGYKASGSNKGAFLNEAIFFKNFDDIPIMIDNYNLSLAKSANQRQLAESKLITNRLVNITDPNANAKDRFYDAASVLTNFSPINFFGKFVDEHDFYRQQQAEFADLALESPTITSQSNNNSLSISENMFGIHIKHAQPNNKEWEKIKKYYNMFGFHVNDENSTVNPFTNEICNYLQFTGSFVIPNCDVSIVEMIKAQFENGVRLWHNNGTGNPMNQDVLLNKMR